MSEYPIPESEFHFSRFKDSIRLGIRDGVNSSMVHTALNSMLSPAGGVVLLLSSSSLAWRVANIPARCSGVSRARQFIQRHQSRWLPGKRRKALRKFPGNDNQKNAAQKISVTGVRRMGAQVVLAKFKVK
jgi:hypothetical protein